ncbi:MAG: HAD hydrolase-like protein [Bacteroidota bacterium]
MAKTLIIFDIDGTLVYSNKADSVCFSQSYQAVFGKPFPSIDWRVYPHVTDHVIFRTAFHQQFDRFPKAEEESTFQAHFLDTIQRKRKTHPQEFHQVPHARQTMEKLLADGQYLCGIATGGWRQPALTKLAFVGIATEQLFMSFADGKNCREDIIQEVIDQVELAGHTIERIVYIGDAVWDAKTTRNMQIPLVGIRRKGDWEVLQAQGVKWILKDYLDYRAFIQAIQEAEPPAPLVLE